MNTPRLQTFLASLRFMVEMVILTIRLPQLSLTLARIWLA